MTTEQIKLLVRLIRDGHAKLIMSAGKVKPVSLI